MCGRFVDPNLQSMGLDDPELLIQPIPQRFNVKPTQDVYVMINGKIGFARWGLIPSWHRSDLKAWKAATINARIEDVAERPAFRGPWRNSRCLIPAGGYFEWTGARSPKQPHVFLSTGNAEVMWFAGLFSLWNDLATCTIMTRAANQDVVQVHERMPVILDSDEQERWLQGSTYRDIGAGARLTHHPVKPFGIKDDGPDLVAPMTPQDGPA